MPQRSISRWGDWSLTLKPQKAWTGVQSRYDLCEDMAATLASTASNVYFDARVCDMEILDRCYAALLQVPETLTASESRWTVLRLAELMDWEVPLWRYKMSSSQ